LKTAADTSVLVASFASWHEHHSVASAAMSRIDVMLAHCVLETYSVLTRLPAPHRIDARVVATYLRVAYGARRTVALSAADHRKLVDQCAAERISGGAIYDAVVGMTARRAGARLLTLDARARATYAAVGVEHEMLG
jgi:predicted nucleic acid-binding protein